MYRILVVGPEGPWRDANGIAPNSIAPSEVTADFFTSDQAQCFISVDPADVERCDGVAVPGGIPDVDPASYGEENQGSAPVDTTLDGLQFPMIKRALELGKPMIGFCRGVQMINVAMGGTLIQDIACKETHHFPSFHMARNIPGTFMYEMYGEKMKINSAHHQALKRLADGFRVSQIWCADETKEADYIQLAQSGKLREGSSECIIEAVYHESLPIVGLQWHPEMGGDMLCKHLDLTKIVRYFYSLMDHSKS